MLLAEAPEVVFGCEYDDCVHTTKTEGDCVKPVVIAISQHGRADSLRVRKEWMSATPQHAVRIM
jgi:hypothetical protein